MQINSKSKNRMLALIMIAAFCLSITPLQLWQVAYAAESVSTSKSLYTFQWTMGTEEQSRPYFNATLNAAGLDPTHVYNMSLSKYGPTGGPSGRSQAISGVTSAEITFQMQDIPQNLAGTYNATLYDDDLSTMVAMTEFGAWGLSGPGYNYGQSMVGWGGGATPNTTCTLRIYNGTHDVTSLLLKNSTIPVGDYGAFSFAGNESFVYPKYMGGYTVEITSYTPIRDGRPRENIANMIVTKSLRVKTYTDKTNYERTETVRIVAEVYHWDWSPVMGTVNATIKDGTATNVPLSWAIAGNYTGNWKIPYNAKLGVWTVNVTATEPSYGNFGYDAKNINVGKTAIIVAITVQPPSAVPRAMYVNMTFTTKYRDGSSATLNLTTSAVHVVNATSGALRAVASLSGSAGTYTAMWWVGPTEPIGGKYNFTMYTDSLIDTAKPDPNTGPSTPIDSNTFVVSETTLIVTVSTHNPTDWTAKIVFMKSDIVGVRSRIIYNNSVVMSSGSVIATIMYPNGSIAGKKSMVWDPSRYDWSKTFDLSSLLERPAGTWTVVVDADDGAGNIGTGQTTFFVAGVSVTPLSGTVGPTTTIDDNGVVSGSVYSVGTRSLGTNVVVTGLAMPPNAHVNVTVSIPTYTSYQAKYGTFDVLVVLNAATDADGAFAASFVFPTAPADKYAIKAKIGSLVYETAQFEVVRGILLDPSVVAGPMIVKTVGTGFMVAENARIVLVDGTDAIVGYNLQSSMWMGDGNGTLKSYAAYMFGGTPSPTSPFAVNPAFTFPVLVDGVYKISLFSVPQYSASYYLTNDTLTVVSRFSEIVTAISNIGLKLDNINATIVRIEGKVDQLGINITELLGGIDKNITELLKLAVQIQTSVGTINTTVGEILTYATDINATAGTIATDVGTIKGWQDDIALISAIKTETDKIPDINNSVSGLPNLTMPIYIAVVLSLIAAISAIVCAILVYRKIA